MEISVSCHNASAPLCAPLARPSRPTPISGIILIFFGIVFGILCGVFKYVVEYNLCKILNEFELECELEFENEMINENDCDYNYADIFNGYYPTLYPTIVDLNISRGGLREQLVLKDLSDIVYGEYDLNNVCEGGFNENFYDNKYDDYGVLLSTPTPAPAPLPTIEFNCINTRNDILDSVFGVNINENDIVNEISFGM